MKSIAYSMPFQSGMDIAQKIATGCVAYHSTAGVLMRDGFQLSFRRCYGDRPEINAREVVVPGRVPQGPIWRFEVNAEDEVIDQLEAICNGDRETSTYTEGPPIKATLGERKAIGS